MDVSQTYHDFSLQIAENLAASRWRSRFVKNRQRPGTGTLGWRVWARTATSTTGYNSETASISSDSDSDSSISDSEKSAVGDGNDSEDEKEPREEARQNME